MVPALSAISVANGSVYFIGNTSSGGTIYALSAETGALLWKTNTAPGIGIADEIVATPDAIIVSSSQAQYSTDTMAVDPKTGKTLWTQPQDSEHMLLGANLLFETVVNLPPPGPGPLSDGSVQAVNPVTGAVVWHSTGHAYRDMALVGTTLYVNAVDALYAFDTQTGNVVWSHNSGITMTQQGSTLFLADGATLSALDGATHSTLWQTPFSGFTAGKVTNGVYCVASALSTYGGGAGGLYGFDVKTGAQLWQTPSSSYDGQVAVDSDRCYSLGAITQTISSVSEMLYNPLNTPIQGLNAQSGSIAWTVNVDSNFNLLAATGGNLYFRTTLYSNGSPSDTVLHVLSGADGSTQWTLDTHDADVGLLAFG
jgi:outer membrane protein assembly factor BamB